jgi:hypothetical protein
MSDLAHPDPSSGLSADIHLKNLLAENIEEPWYKSLLQNVKDLISPPKLPPLQITSKPVAVKDIWGLYGGKKESGVMSLAFHAAVIVVLFTLGSNKAVQQKVKEAVHLVGVPDIAPYTPELAPKPKMMQGGGGGGDRSPTPASKGRAPKFSPRQFVPPAAVVNNPNPKLLMDPTLIGPPTCSCRTTICRCGAIRWPSWVHPRTVLALEAESDRVPVVESDRAKAPVMDLVKAVASAVAPTASEEV